MEPNPSEADPKLTEICCHSQTPCKAFPGQVPPAVALLESPYSSAVSLEPWCWQHPNSPLLPLDQTRHRRAEMSLSQRVPRRHRPNLVSPQSQREQNRPLPVHRALFAKASRATIR
jgi:hypothetical protein